jgi:hypothetical protein
MSMNRGKIAGLAAGLIALAALAGCDSSTPESAAPAENIADNTEAVNVVVPEEAPVPETLNAAAVEAPRETPPDPDAQTQEDADATGMTARVRRDEAPANETIQ